MASRAIKCPQKASELYIHIYIYMSTYIYICMGISIYVYLWASVYEYIYLCTYTCIHIHLHIHTLHTGTSLQRPHSELAGNPLIIANPRGSGRPSGNRASLVETCSPLIQRPWVPRALHKKGRTRAAPET